MLCEGLLLVAIIAIHDKEAHDRRVVEIDNRRQEVFVRKALNRIEFFEERGFCYIRLEQQGGELKATLVSFWFARGFTYSSMPLTEKYRQIWRQSFG